MQICKEHWEALKQGVEDRGMGGLVGTAESAMESLVKEVEGGPPDKKSFDPLMAANNYMWRIGLEMIGISAMTVDETPGAPNDGHCCPLCELKKSFEAHKKGECKDPICTITVAPDEKPWDETQMFEKCLDPMRAYCIEQGLISKPC